VILHHGEGEALPLETIASEPRLVRQPLLVDVLVGARQDAQNLEQGLVLTSGSLSSKKLAPKYALIKDLIEVRLNLDHFTWIARFGNDKKSVICLSQVRHNLLTCKSELLKPRVYREPLPKGKAQNSLDKQRPIMQMLFTFLQNNLP
jgi:hypothetical protein